MELLADLLMPSLWAFLACVGFGLVYNIQGAGILICGFGGALGWFFYLIARQWVGSIVAAFLAAVAITVFSEWMARVRRCPVTGYLQVALLPLVPGSGIYYSLRFCLAGVTQKFLSQRVITFGMAESLAIGAMLTSTVLRLLLPYFQGSQKNSG